MGEERAARFIDEGSLLYGKMKQVDEYLGIYRD